MIVLSNVFTTIANNWPFVILLDYLFNQQTTGAFMADGVVQEKVIKLETEVDNIKGNVSDIKAR